MDINELTIGQVGELTKLFGKTSSPEASPLKVGNAVFLRTVTNYFTGRIVALSDKEIVIEEAAWVAYTGRFATALEKGTFDEVEPYPTGFVSINRDGYIDASIWKHPLPREQK